MIPLEPRLEVLARRLAGLAARRPGFALALCGEAGIGKSHAARTLLGACPCASFSTPATRPLASVLGGLPQPRKCPAALEHALARLRRGEVLEPRVVQGALSLALAALAPAVLYVEDLHEASPEALEAWCQLAERLAGVRGVALLSSSRSIPPAPFEALTLARLSEAQSRTLLEAEVHAPLPTEACAWIHARAAGNPLFTLEFFRSLARGGFAWSDGARWHWRVPPEDRVPVSVEALIERTLREATPSPQTRAALEARALLPEADLTLLAAVADMSTGPLEAALAHLRARGVLTTSGFAHPLYRELALSGLRSGDRQTLSRRALEALETRDPEAAAGFAEAAGLEPVRALALLQDAASRARARGNPVQAGRFLAQALAFAPGPERGKLALEASVALEGAEVAESLRLAELACLELPQHLAATLNLAGKRVSASRRVEDAETLLAGLPPELREAPEVLRSRLGFCMVCGDFRGALERWQNAAAAGAELDPTSAYYVAASLAQTGRFQDAETCVAGALEHPTLEPTARIRLLNIRGMAQTFLGHPETAEQAQREAIALARAQGMWLVLAASLQNYALNLERTERYTERLDAAREAVEAYLRVGETQRAHNAQLVVAACLQERGEFPAAEALLLECWEGLRGVAPPAFVLAVACALVKLYLDWNPAPARLLAEKFAAHALHEAGILGEGMQISAYAHALEAAVQARWGDPARSLEAAQRAARIAGDASNQLGFIVQGALACALEAQGETASAQQGFERASALAQELGFALDAQLYALEADRLRSDPEAARARLGWFEARGLHSGTALAMRLFPEALEPQAETQRAPLRLEALGPLRLEGQNVRGGKRRELLQALLEARVAGKSGLSTLELLETLYPGESEESATSALKQTVFKARTSHAPALIVTTPEGYALGEVSSDAEDFLRQGDTRLWRGAYRPQPGSGAVLETLCLALKAGLNAALEPDPPEAARGARLLCEMDPYDPESLRLLCRALHAGGNYKSLTREYAQGRQRMGEVGEILPEAWADFLGTREPARLS